MYKVYAVVLAERLKMEVEEKGLIPQNQTGFRRGMGTMDNIYVLNYLNSKQANREKKRENGSNVCKLIKAAFDSVDRERLIKTMRENKKGANR